MCKFMFCEECELGYQNIKCTWKYENESTYSIKTNVFYVDTLKEILEDAIIRKLKKIYVDTVMPDTSTCEKCILLHIRLRKERTQLLEEQKYQHIFYQEFF